MIRSASESKMSTRTLLVFVGRRPEAAPTFILSDAGRILQRGVLQVGQIPPLDGARVVVIVPGEHTTARWLSLPPSRDREARTAARLLMEEHLAASDDLHVAVGPYEDGKRVGVVVSRSALQAWRTEAVLHGLEPDVVVPDMLLAPAPRDDVLQVASLDGMTLVMGQELAMTSEPDAAALVVEGRPVRQLSDAEREAAFLSGLARPRINLLQGELAGRDAIRPRDFRLAAVLAAALLVSPLIITLAQTIRHEAAAAVLTAKAKREVAAVLPAGTAITDPVAQLDERLAQLTRGTNSFAAQTAALHAALEDLEGAQLESLIFTPDGTLRIAMSHDNYSDVEQLRVALRRSDLALREEGSRTEGERLITDLIVGARP